MGRSIPKSLFNYTQHSPDLSLYNILHRSLVIFLCALAEGIYIYNKASTSRIHTSRKEKVGRWYTPYKAFRKSKSSLMGNGIFFGEAGNIYGPTINLSLSMCVCVYNVWK